MRGVPRAGARVTTRGGCQYPTRCPGGFRTVTRKCSLVHGGDFVCAQRDGSSALSSCVNRVIPWCGVAPVGFFLFLSREAARAGFSPAATSLGQPASGMVDKLLVRFMDDFHFIVLLGGGVAMLFCTLSPRACGPIVVRFCRFISTASWH